MDISSAIGWVYKEEFYLDNKPYTSRYPNAWENRQGLIYLQKKGYTMSFQINYKYIIISMSTQSFDKQQHTTNYKSTTLTYKPLKNS